MAAVLKKYLPQFLILLLASGFYLSGNLAWLERWLLDLRFELVEREASGDIVVVEIDAASLQVLDSWPWPRRYHATVLDRLIDAGATTVAFSLDFSAYSSAADDTILAAALSRAAGRAVLPVFRQPAGAGRSDAAVLANLPIGLFARSARLAAANIYADADGRVRRIPVGDRVAGKNYISMPVLLTGAAAGLPMTIPIDYSLRPESVPRLSFKDVHAGRFDPAAVRGKAVIIGATALELGGYLPTPVHAALSGPVLHALAYETIVQDRLLVRLHEPVVLLGAAILVFLLGPQLFRLRWQAGAVVAALYLLGFLVLSAIAQVAFAVVVEISPWVLSVVGVYLGALCVAIERKSLDVLRRRMEIRQNRAIIDAAMQTIHEGLVICDWDGNIRVINDAAAAIFGERRAAMVGRPIESLIDRLVCDEIPMFYTKLSHALMQLSDMGRPLLATLHRPGSDRRRVELEVSRAVVRKDEEEGERRGSDRVYFTISLRDVTDRATDFDGTRLGPGATEGEDELVLRPDRLN